MKNYHLHFLIIATILLIGCDRTVEIPDANSQNKQQYLYDELTDEIAFPSQG